MKTLVASSLAIAMLCGLMAVAGAQTAPAGPAKVAGTGSTALLTDAKGMTLYEYDKDASGKSACNGPCAANWPPLAAAAADKPTGKFTVVTRDDGSLMWAYAGKPLYTWKNDKAPGDTTGDGVGGSWHVARPDGTPAAARAQGAPPAPSVPGGAPGGGSAY
jgi:predicted lipoprotein with Yx(FWY)xxD motif